MAIYLTRRTLSGARTWRSPFTVAIGLLFAVALAACDAETSTSPPPVATSGAVGGGTLTSDAPTPTPTPTATTTPTPTATPTLKPVATTKPPQAVNTCGAPANPWGYNFCGGNVIYNPPGTFCNYFSCIPSFWKSTNGYVEQCADGLFSHSGGRSGSCSYHGGNRRPLYGP